MVGEWSGAGYAGKHCCIRRDMDSGATLQLRPSVLGENTNNDILPCITTSYSYRSMWARILDSNSEDGNGHANLEFGK